MILRFVVSIFSVVFIFARFSRMVLLLWAILCGGFPFEISDTLAAEISSGDSRPPPGTPTSPAMRQAIWQLVMSELRNLGGPDKALPGIEDLDVPSALPPLGGRRLRVASACWDEGTRRSQFRLECDQPGQCLPFFVYLHRDVYLHKNVYPPQHNDVAARDALSGETFQSVGSDAVAESCRPTLELHHVALGLHSPRPVVVKPTVSPGDRAVAVFVSNHFKMSATVICLDRGREGEVIRVRSQNGQVFRARISGPALLEALP